MPFCNTKLKKNRKYLMLMYWVTEVKPTQMYTYPRNVSQVCWKAVKKAWTLQAEISTLELKLKSTWLHNLRSELSLTLMEMLLELHQCPNLWRTGHWTAESLLLNLPHCYREVIFRFIYITITVSFFKVTVGNHIYIHHICQWDMNQL